MKKKILITIKEYALITVGILLYVIAWTVFLAPNNLVGGGVTGIASIVQYATKGFVKMGTVYFSLNVVLIILALFILGKNFGAKTVYAIVIASVGLNVLQGLIPSGIIQTLSIDNGKLMCTIIGGIIVGVGIGMSMSQGGSTGGTDIIALIVNKYRNVSPGRMILATDAVIIMSSFFVPSYTSSGALVPITEKFTTVIYGFILITIVSTVLDMYLSGSRQSVQLFILSPRYAEIADEITHNLHRGVTVLDGKGWYTQKSTQVLMVITRKSDLNIFLRTVKSIDPNAFLSVSSVAAVYGQGFETYRDNKKVKS